jgi:rhodanese-related sulfurtransferase
MWNNIKKWLSGGSSVDYKELVGRGAVIVDVRSKGEYASGHIKGSINIPLDQLGSRISSLPKKPIITCCASGMRSASARSLLQSKGFEEVYNGGGWSALNRAIHHS